MHTAWSSITCTRSFMESSSLRKSTPWTSLASNMVANFQLQGLCGHFADSGAEQGCLSTITMMVTGTSALAEQRCTV